MAERRNTRRPSKKMQGGRAKKCKAAEKKLKEMQGGRAKKCKAVEQKNVRWPSKS
jgi:hypothetical protein